MNNNFPDKLKIHVIPYCHADHAWTHSRQWHIKRYRRILDEVLDIMKANPSYTFTLDNIFHMLSDYLKAPGSRELIEAINSGRIEMTGPVLSLIRPTRAGGEAFIRNVQYAREYLREKGISTDSETYYNIDTSVGHPQLPQILKLLGFSNYRFWRPQGAMDAMGIPRQFIWEGPDGTRIICSRGTYAGLWKADYLNISNFTDGIIMRFYNEELADITKHNTTGIIWLPFGMDDTRPLMDFDENPINLDGLMRHLRETSGIQINYSTPRDYFLELQKQKLPVISGSLDPCDAAYNIPTKGDKGLWLYRYLLEKLIIKAEISWVLADTGKYPYDAFRKLWENLLYISGHAMEFSFEDDFEHLLDVAETSLTLVNSLINEVVRVTVKDRNERHIPFHVSSFSDEMKTGSECITFKNGCISSINGIILENPIGFIEFTSIKNSSKDAWLNNHDHGESSGFVVEKHGMTENGPERWRYEASGSVGFIKADIAYTVDAFEPGIRIDIKVENHTAANGFLSVSFPVSSNPEYIGGIPFGHEIKYIENNVYGKVSDIEIDNLERLWPGLFYFNDWLTFNSTIGHCAVINRRIPPYVWSRRDEGKMSLILTRTFDLGSCRDWMSRTHHTNECLGTHDFSFNLLTSNDHISPTKAAMESNRIHYPPTDLISNNSVDQLFSLNSGYCILSTMYMNKGNYIIRVYNSSSFNDTLIIKSIRVIRSCEVIDLKSMVIEDRKTIINKRGLSVSVTVRPSEILTLSIKLVQ
jgi:alpha-mannosidase